MHRRDLRARPRLGDHALHAEHAFVPGRRGLDVLHVHDEMIEGFDGERHGCAQSLVTRAWRMAERPSLRAARQRAIAPSTASGSLTSSPCAPTASATLEKSMSGASTEP